MTDAFVALLLLTGSLFMLLAAVGILRMPDLYTRMATSTKASTLGLACILAAVALHFPEIGIRTRAMAAVVFVFLTAPVAAHMIGRAAYVVGVPLWKGTIIDELQGRPDRLSSPVPERPDDGTQPDRSEPIRDPRTDDR